MKIFSVLSTFLLLFSFTVEGRGSVALLRQLRALGGSGWGNGHHGGDNGRDHPWLYNGQEQQEQSAEEQQQQTSHLTSEDTSSEEEETVTEPTISSNNVEKLTLKDDSMPVAAIVLGTLGSVIFMFLLATAAVFYCDKNSKGAAVPMGDENDDSTENDSSYDA